MRNILLETSNFNGDIILENFEFEGDYDHLFKGIRKAFKERGLLGGIGQITGLSTNKGAERRAENREKKQDRKEDRNERKNILAEAKAAVKESTAAQQVAEAINQQSQAGLVDSLAKEQAQVPAQEQTTSPDPVPKEDNTIMYASIGGAILLVIVLVLILMRRKSNPV